MPIFKRFVMEKHEDFGTMGLRPEDTPHADPYGGMAVAHDMLEHFPKDDGGIECELMALGAAVFVRGESGYFSSRPVGNPDAAENIASDFRDIASHNVHERFSFRAPGPTRPCPESAEEMIQRVATKARKLLREEGHDGEFDAWLTDEARARVVGWMRKGYRRAARRFRNVDQYSLMECGFRKLEEEADKLLKYADESQEGQRVAFSLDLQTWNVRVVEERDAYDY